MRNATLRVGGVLLLAGALAAVVASMTVQWLYPRRLAATAALPAPGGETPSPGVAAAAQPAPDTPEHTAMEVIRRAAAGDMPGAQALGAGLSEERLLDSVTRLRPAPVRAATLPGTGKEGTRLLVWVDYQRVGKHARGVYQVTITGGKATSLEGPLALPGESALSALKPLDEQGRRIDPVSWRGRSLLLVAPRRPEPELAHALARLQADYAPRGIEVVLLIDIGSPDWAGAARQAGFKGPVWRAKARLETVAVANQGRFLGAVGVLIDREGYPVGPFAALDPLRYDIPDQPLGAVAPTVFKAYGLLP